MKSLLPVLVILFFQCHASAQDCVFSSVPMKPSAHTQILGHVKDHILFIDRNNDKSSGPQIIVMDLNMKVINTIYTKQRLVPANVYYNIICFTDAAGAHVAVEYKKNYRTILRLATFNYDGNLESNILLDSVNLKNLDNTNRDFEYKFLQSPKDKSLFMFKLVNDASNFLLKTYYNQVYPVNKLCDSFYLPFDSRISSIIDFKLDEQANFLILKLTNNTGSEEQLELVKKIPRSPDILIAKHDLGKGFLNTHNGFSVLTYKDHFVLLGQILRNIDSNLIESKGDAFIWQVDTALNDAPGYKILSDSFTNSVFSVFAMQPTSDGFVFVIKSIIMSNRAFLAQQSNPPKLPESTKSFYSGRLTKAGLGSDVNNNNQANQNIVDSNLNHFEIPPSSKQRLLENFTLNILHVDSNGNILWFKPFIDNGDKIHTTDISESSIFPVNNKLRLLYKTEIKGGRFLLNEMNFNDDGSYSVKSKTSWKLNYNPFPSQGVQITEHYFVLPCEHNNRIYYAKILLN